MLTGSLLDVFPYLGVSVLRVSCVCVYECDRRARDSPGAKSAQRRDLALHAPLSPPRGTAEDLLDGQRRWTAEGLSVIVNVRNI